jgi:hypothetical protein
MTIQDLLDLDAALATLFANARQATRDAHRRGRAVSAAVAARLLRDAMMRIGGGRYRRHQVLSTPAAELLVLAELGRIIDAQPDWLPQRVTP